MAIQTNDGVQDEDIAIEELRARLVKQLKFLETTDCLQLDPESGKVCTLRKFHGGKHYDGKEFFSSCREIKHFFDSHECDSPP